MLPGDHENFSSMSSSWKNDVIQFLRTRREPQRREAGSHLQHFLKGSGEATSRPCPTFPWRAVEMGGAATESWRQGLGGVTEPKGGWRERWARLETWEGEWPRHQRVIRTQSLSSFFLLNGKFQLFRLSQYKTKLELHLTIYPGAVTLTWFPHFSPFLLSKCLWIGLLEEQGPGTHHSNLPGLALLW